ncbi:hypothetical protein BDW72DRAFT_206052 [Aspergillus terricola var. indicus]
MSASHHLLTFDAPYAILNLDWMTTLIAAIEDTPQGQTFISTASIGMTHLSFNPNQPEVQLSSPFAKLIAPYGEFTTDSHDAQIDKRLQVDKFDIVLQKTRWSAMAGNPLEQILRAKGIRSVVVTGLSLSGVVMSTVYRLSDLDYNVYMIRDNVLELPVEQTAEVAHVMMDI